MDDEIRAIIAEINSHSHSVADETLDDVLAMGRGLVRLFGYRDRKRKIDIPGRLKLRKKQYPELGLRPGYGWTRRLMKIAMDDKIADPKYRDVLPRGRNNLEQCARMKLARFEQGIKPDPNQRGEIAIHPEATYPDLVAYRTQAAEIKPPKPRQLVLVIILGKPDAKPTQEKEQGDSDWKDSVIDTFRNAAFEENLQFAVAEVKSKNVKESMFENASQKQVIWTLDMGRIEKTPRTNADEL